MDKIANERIIITEKKESLNKTGNKYYIVNIGSEKSCINPNVKNIENSVSIYVDSNNKTRNFYTMPSRQIIRIFGKYDENGLHEIITGKLLKKWPIEPPYYSKNKNIMFYESLDEVSEDCLNACLEVILKGNADKYEYAKELEKLQDKYCNKHFLEYQKTKVIDEEQKIMLLKK